VLCFLCSSALLSDAIGYCLFFALIGIYCLDTHQIADTIAQSESEKNTLGAVFKGFPCAGKDKQVVSLFAKGRDRRVRESHTKPGDDWKLCVVV
jgi:hypothetical protein